MKAQYTVYTTQKDENGEWRVQRIGEMLPKRQAVEKAKKLQTEESGKGQLVHTSTTQFYAMNSVSGKIAW